MKISDKPKISLVLMFLSANTSCELCHVTKILIYKKTEILIKNIDIRQVFYVLDFYLQKQ